MMGILAAATGSSVFNAFGAFSSASAAKREAKAQAKMEEMKTAEEARRMSVEQNQINSLTRAIMGASGTTGEGSQQIYLNDMMQEQARELDWLKTVGSYNASSIRRQGQAIAKQYQMQGINSLFQAGTSMALGGKK